MRVTTLCIHVKTERTRMRALDGGTQRGHLRWVEGSIPRVALVMVWSSPINLLII